MATIIPFTGLRYNQDKVPFLSSVVTPPYDIIDEKAQARYYAENPFNLIRLELGLIFQDDSENNNRYSRARKYLDKWIEDDILLSDNKPSLYFYQQEFDGPHGKLVRNGFICGLKVEDYARGNVLPHEETLSKPKADRLQLMKATRCNFSSVFGLYDDPEKVVDTSLLSAISEREPDAEMVDEADEIHRLWVIDNEKILNTVISCMSDKKVFIADGHHRYETALEYSRFMQESGYKGYDYVMITLVNLYDQGLVILPTHRVVGNLQGFNLNSFKDSLQDLFEIEACQSDDLFAFTSELAKRGRKKHVFGMYTSEKQLYILTLRNMTQAKKHLPRDKSDAWKKLDVALLDNLVLDRCLGIGEKERKNQDNLSYTRDENWVINSVAEGNYQLGFILNPTRVKEVVAVAQARDKMPQKSTYFYPKLITGMVVNPIYLNSEQE
ncbi:MAG: DUF1015 domain-containing protein [Chitinophagales bacterium]